MLRKINDFVSKEFNNIMIDSREYKAYELGYANGIFALYETIKKDYGKDIANQSFMFFIKSSDNIGVYFREMLALSEKENTEADETLDKFSEYNI